ncbi:CRISPR-associated helicase Cas3' [Longirhabdus pacifica]|uniref:CRISPR-associated helicase Cas3' n=1 Tax=Longirhabdus pacifica TaxID=2305227 RepID=UPI0013E8BE2E|nr:CRISPR-associated helicase Cas3' [Longirhabdus pacifica]
MIYYAKSQPVETIQEHTAQLLTRFSHFKNLYQHKINIFTERDWDLLELCVKYHDIGKADVAFQMKIRKNMIENGLQVEVLPETIPHSSNDIPHSLLSVMALPEHIIELTQEEKTLVFQTIAFHHEREYGLYDDSLKKQIRIQYEQNILPYHIEIEAQHNLKISMDVKESKINKLKRRISPDHDKYAHLYKKYVLMKGLLHRLDHAASAHVPIELATEFNTAAYVNHFFQTKLKTTLKPLQQFTLNHQDHHVVVVAQTGMGKTEAALLWLGEQKGIFTLPLRVSINAMYKRIRDEENLHFSKWSDEYGEEAVGLLHATSLDYLYDEIEANDQLLEKVHGQSKQFANKLIISTIDQVLKFPFYYLGFEKEYATMATCKVIVDELQAYDPKIAALLIRAMTLIDRIGGSFMIMTATLPPFYFNALERELEECNIPFKFETFIDDDVVRHHVRTRDHCILDNDIIAEITETGTHKKVLVICNTVKQAQEVFKELEQRERNDDNLFLLHARFTKRDRSRLEKEILTFAKGDKVGIWVTTQLVEASLDIDFDVLYTEMSSLDSQFQRYGRCNRKGLKSVKETNIHVMLHEVSGNGTVYHQEIYDYSVKLLSRFHSGILKESVKQEMINDLYDEQRLENEDSEFKKEFDKALREFKNRPHYKLKKAEAQELLRDIQQIEVIPKELLNDEEFQQHVVSWQIALTPVERRKRRKRVEAYSIAVNEWKAKKIGINKIDGTKELYYIHCSYCERTGLLTEEIDFID